MISWSRIQADLCVVVPKRLSRSIGVRRSERKYGEKTIFGCCNRRRRIRDDSGDSGSGRG